MNKKQEELIFLFNKYTEKQQINILRRFKQHYKNQTRSRTRKYLKEKSITFTKCLCCRQEDTIEIHHVDYENPYLIIPLCFKCHKRQHSKEKQNLVPINLLEYVYERKLD